MISVIVCTYNLRKSLKAMLDAFTRQTFKNFELILVDNGPFDENFDYINSLIKSYNYKIIVVSKKKNLGPGAGRNFGIKAASGDYIAFTDDDCIPANNWLEVINIELVEKHCQVITGPVESSINPRFPFIHSFNCIGHTIFLSGNSAFTKKWFIELGGFDEFLNNWAEDFEIGERTIRKGQPYKYISNMIVDHPPVLGKYELKKFVMSFSFLEKYFYIIKIKKYKYKEKIIFKTFLHAFIKLLFITLFLFIPSPLLIINLLFPILILMLRSSFTVIKINKILSHSDLEFKIPFSNSLYYVLTLWAMEIVNFFMIIFFYIYTLGKRLKSAYVHKL